MNHQHDWTQDITPIGQLAHECRAALARIEGVEVIELEPGQQVGADPGPDVETFGLQTLSIFPVSLGVDAYKQPWSNENPPPHTPGMLPMESSLRKLLVQLMHELEVRRITPADTWPFWWDDPQGAEMVPFKFQGFTFVLVVQTKPGDSTCAITGMYLFVDSQKISIDGRRRT